MTIKLTSHTIQQSIMLHQKHKKHGLRTWRPTPPTLNTCTLLKSLSFYSETHVHKIHSDALLCTCPIAPGPRAALRVKQAGTPGSK